MSAISVTDLPFNRFIGLQPAEAPQLLQLPAGEQYLNHLGTVHASAQLALAEAASGEYLLRHFGTAGGLVPLVRRLEAKFRRPASGSISASVTATTPDLEVLRTALAAKGRAIISIVVSVQDGSGQQTLTAEVEWFIASAPG